MTRWTSLSLNDVAGASMNRLGLNLDRSRRLMQAIEMHGVDWEGKAIGSIPIDQPMRGYVSPEFHAWATTDPDAVAPPSNPYSLQVRRGGPTGFDLLGPEAGRASRSPSAREECRPVDAWGNYVFAAVRGDGVCLTAQGVGANKKFRANLYFICP